MINLKEILLLGGGSHSASVIDTLIKQNEYSPIGILDICDKVGSTISNVPIIGVDEKMQEIFDSGVKYAFITIGSIGNTSIREKLYDQAKQIGFEFPIIIDPSAIISNNVEVAEGTFIGKGSILNTKVKIGSNSIINTGAIIDHDSVVGDFVHIAPGSTFSGNVIIGDRTHIGTNSTVIQEVNIGKDTLIGAGSVVIRDIGNQRKAYGNPCREVNKNV